MPWAAVDCGSTARDPRFSRTLMQQEEADLCQLALDHHGECYTPQG